MKKGKNLRFIKRTLSNIIQKTKSDKVKIAITGIGECGKDSCISSVYDKMPHILMGNMKNIILAGNSSEEFFKKYGTNLIIDNIEEVLDLLKDIKEEYNIILIADNNIDEEYKKHISSFITYKLHGLSIYELANMGHMQKPYIPQDRQPCIISRKSISYTYQLIWRGFLPEAALIEDNKLLDEIISSKVEKILKNSIMGCINISNKLIFLNFLKELTLYIGCELNISELAEKLNMAPNTIKNWIKLLESINFIYLIPAYYTENKRRYIRTPKLYMEDTGIAAWLLNFDEPKKLEEYEKRDKFFENFVVSEIIKSYHHNGQECRLYHYRDNLKVKIDLLIEDDEYIYPVNISGSKDASYEMVSSFEKAALHKKLGYGNLISLSEKSIKLSDRISAFSIWEI